MCGRFTLFAEYNEIIDRFSIEAAIDAGLYVPSYNIAPSHSVLSVINDGNKNRLGFLRWGLIPSWAKDEKIGYKMINARAETISEKPSFRQAYNSRRCLIIADSFYEWKRKDDKTKIPIRIKLKSNKMFAMAGIWERWTSPSGDTVYSCSVITTEPNELMNEIHDRMPVILKKEDEKTWLNPAIQVSPEISKLLKPLPAHLMEAYEVSSLVNSPRNNSPNLIQEIC
ncbi:SOS response-associated peptidase [Fredinandcohnia sp. 179-A 10B2 NHS]|uniref:SOS response-associated peptidase n=1 Tax=Fredinandcohnia sp. 179-A 10B2 NHS TaxID=3235176 RepID=UPI00399FDC42